MPSATFRSRPWRRCRPGRAQCIDGRPRHFAGAGRFEPGVPGRIGRGRHAALTALGDSVNIASRLEGLNKDFASNVVASQAALDDADLLLDGAALRSVPVRGREQALPVAAASELEGLRETRSIEAVA